MIKKLVEQQVKPHMKWVVTETNDRRGLSRVPVKPHMKWVVTET